MSRFIETETENEIEKLDDLDKFLDYVTQYNQLIPKTQNVMDNQNVFVNDNTTLTKLVIKLKKLFDTDLFHDTRQYFLIDLIQSERTSLNAECQIDIIFLLIQYLVQNYYTNTNTVNDKVVNYIKTQDKSGKTAFMYLFTNPSWISSNYKYTNAESIYQYAIRIFINDLFSKPGFYDCMYAQLTDSDKKLVNNNINYNSVHMMYKMLSEDATSFNGVKHGYDRCTFNFNCTNWSKVYKPCVKQHKIDEDALLINMRDNNKKRLLDYFYDSFNQNLLMVKLLETELKKLGAKQSMSGQVRGILRLNRTVSQPGGKKSKRISKRKKTTSRRRRPHPKKT